ncbi:FAD-linked sulfhydryl oxidase ALR isoform X2 [Hydra vulgaris]|uniref:Sulfhydryl oxidase n=1 Tax=Hydra vulgaris TaxID=6087 RepID=A0ABM4CBR1_HYDVU
MKEEQKQASQEKSKVIDNLEKIFFDKPETVPKKPCRTCTEFKNWTRKMTGTTTKSNNNTVEAKHEKNISELKRVDCPLDSTELGRSTWSFLHTMAAYYPEQPTTKQQNEMKDFINIFSKFYPCSWCAKHLQERLKTDVPDTRSSVALSQWFCELHNEVNQRLGKPIFDCSKVFERWKDGWVDGSCD